MNNHYYNKNLKEYARKLRSESVSKAEKRLWKTILSRNQTGERFLRQRSILNFIVDFFCPKLKLIIEIDGSSHFIKCEYDAYRQEKLKALGFHIIRVSEGEVINCLDDVKMKIDFAIYCLKNES